MRSQLLLCASLLGLGGCGAGEADPDPGADAGAQGCALYLTPPASASVGQEVEVGVYLETGTVGLISYSWSIELNGVSEALTELSDPPDRVSFVPDDAGPYQVLVNASVDNLSCTPAIGTINVTATGALSADYRMRIHPQGEAPMQEVEMRIYGGADAVLPITTLATGFLVNGRVTDAAGAGVSAYVRARMRGVSNQRDYEAFSDASGDFSMRLPDARYDVSVIPSGANLPGVWLENIDPVQLQSTVLLPTPIGLSGHLLDASGAGLAGARVSLIVDGARSTEGLTGGDGSFSVLGAEGLLTGIRVAPPEGSGLPSLLADGLLGQSISSASDAILRYSQPQVSAQVDIDLAGGAAAPGARVEWRAELDAAATVDLGSGTQDLGGSLRVQATADASGIAQSPLSGVTADLVVFSADSSQARIVRDLVWSATPSTALVLSPLVSAPVVVDRGGAPLVAELVATPLDSLAPQTEAPHTQSAADGSASLALVRGGNYQLVASEPRQGRTTLLLSDVAPGIATSPLSLPGTLVATGLVQLAGGGVAAGAQVSFYCANCQGEEASLVRASALVDAAGRFSLRIPDPGVASP